MKRIFVFFISLALYTGARGQVQDSLLYPVGLRISIDVAGPLLKIYDPSSLTIEGKAAFDLNGNHAIAFEAGSVTYQYEQYNYSYKNSGLFFRLGTDYNLLSPKNSNGKYFAGIGLRYGLSFFTQEYPWFLYENGWGTVQGSILPSTYSAHFIEASPGMRAEIFKNFSLGWTIRIGKLIYQSAPDNMKPVIIPGMGSIAKSMSYGFNYYLTWNIPMGKKMIYIKPKSIPEEPEPEPEIK